MVEKHSLQDDTISDKANTKNLVKDLNPFRNAANESRANLLINVKRQTGPSNETQLSYAELQNYMFRKTINLPLMRATPSEMFFDLEVVMIVSPYQFVFKLFNTEVFKALSAEMK